MQIKELISENSVSEGAVGAGIGAGLGALALGPLGAAAGAGIGNWIGNKLTGGAKAKAQKLRQQAQQLTALANQYDGMGGFTMPKFGNVSQNSPMQDERFIFSIQNAKGDDVELIRKLLKAQSGVKEGVADWAGKIGGMATAARQGYQQARGSLFTKQELQQNILKLSSAEAQQLLKFFNVIHPEAAPAAPAGQAQAGAVAPNAGTAPTSLTAANPLANNPLAATGSGAVEPAAGAPKAAGLPPPGAAPESPEAIKQRIQTNLAKSRTANKASGYASSRVGVPVQKMTGADAQGNPVFQTVRESTVNFHSKFLGMKI